MYFQPPEILENIFKHFPAFSKDLHKCFTTCLKWRQIIQSMNGMEVVNGKTYLGREKIGHVGSGIGIFYKVGILYSKIL